MCISTNSEVSQCHKFKAHWFDSHLEAIVFLLKLPRESYDKEDNNDDDKDDDVDGDNDVNVDNNNVDNDNDDMK